MLRSLFGLVLFLAALTVGLYSYWALRELPNIDGILAQEVNNPTRYTQVLDRDGQPIYSYGKFQQRQTSLKDVSAHFIHALLATEDRRFYHHFGIDPIGIIRALVVNITQKRLNEGASTITQQVVRNLFLTNERSYKRKLREVVLAVQLEQRLSKDEILTLYINNVYFGEGTYGVTAASDVYFHKAPNQLTVSEAALLAGLPQAPSSYNPFYHKETAKDRRNEVLQNMVEAGYLSSEEVQRYQEQSVSLNPVGTLRSQSNRAPYFNQMVMGQVQKYFGLDEQGFWQSGLKIYTTLDRNAQRQAQRAVVESGLLQKTKTQVAAIMLDAPTGGILAYIGGKQYRESQFDRVTSALRPPGSLFKVFTYTAAMESGMPLHQVWMDEPTSYGKYQPKNYNGKHAGAMTIANAFMTSNNVVAVKLLHELTPQRVISVARRLGIRSRLEENLSLTLGSSAMTLWEATGAVGVLASQGRQVEPYAIEKILDGAGHEVYTHTPPDRQLLDQPTVEAMQALMAATVQFGTARAANIGRPAAGKTGTSDNHRDGWFVGYTPNTVLGVWMGRDDNQPVNKLSGGGEPAQFWAQVMRGFHGRRLAADFTWQTRPPLSLAAIQAVDLRYLAPSEHSEQGVLDPTLLDEHGNPLLGPQPFGQGQPNNPPQWPIVGPPLPHQQRAVQPQVSPQKQPFRPTRQYQPQRIPQRPRHTIRPVQSVSKPASPPPSSTSPPLPPPAAVNSNQSSQPSVVREFGL